MVLCIWTGRSRFFSQFNFFNIRQKSIALTFNCKENTDPVCVCGGVSVCQFGRAIGLWKSCFSSEY